MSFSSESSYHLPSQRRRQYSSPFEKLTLAALCPVPGVQQGYEAKTILIQDAVPRAQIATLAESQPNVCSIAFLSSSHRGR